MRAQLRDVLAAEDSTVVAQENKHRRLPDPKRTEPDFFAIYVRQGNHGKAAIEGGLHVSILGLPVSMSSPACISCPFDGESKNRSRES